MQARRLAKSMTLVYYYTTHSLGRRSTFLLQLEADRSRCWTTAAADALFTIDRFSLLLLLLLFLLVSVFLSYFVVIDDVRKN